MGFSMVSSSFSMTVSVLLFGMWRVIGLAEGAFIYAMIGM